MNNGRIVFVGAGNMARSIIGGLVAQGESSESIIACDPNEQNLAALVQDFAISTASDNGLAVANADVVVLSVKPQVMKEVCIGLAPSLPPGALVISIAAGISSDSIDKWLGGGARIVRCMPNTPALVQCGASGLYASESVTTQQKTVAQNILEAVGLAFWLDNESDIDPVTAVSGSGPAYFFLMLEAMVEAGVAQGLPESIAEKLAIQTAAGAAKLAQASDVSLAELRRRVTSPGGTTEQAINTFEDKGFRGIVKDAMQACTDRSRQMAAEMGE